jgi:hypothetical protein
MQFENELSEYLSLGNAVKIRRGARLAAIAAAETKGKPGAAYCNAVTTTMLLT